MTELEKCPFCGGEVILEVNTLSQYFFSCNGCNLIACFSGKEETEAEAIEAWNRRG